MYAGCMNRGFHIKTYTNHESLPPPLIHWEGYVNTYTTTSITLTPYDITHTHT